MKRGSTRPQSVKNRLWRRLWTCLEEDYVLIMTMIMMKYCLRYFFVLQQFGPKVIFFFRKFLILGVNKAGTMWQELVGKTIL